MNRLATFLVPGRELGQAAELARHAESLGYESAWVTHGLGRDAFLVLAAYGAATTRLGLGSGVIPIYPRHPAAMAQAALTLSELTGGRFRLGIGVSHQASMESMLGLSLREPLAVMREYVTVLRGAFGEGAHFSGQYYRVEWRMGIPRMPPAPPIYLATLSVKMLELAGEIADGAVLWLCPPAYIRDVAVPALTRGRRKAGKTLEGFEIVAPVPLAVTDDRATTLTAFRGELGRYLTLPFYRKMFETAGLGAEVQAFDRTGQATEAFAAALGVVGDPGAARAFVQAHRDAGVTLPTVRPITFTDSAWARRTLEAAAGA